MNIEQRSIYLSLLRRLRGMTSVAASGILRAPSLREQAESYKQPGYYQFFCLHSKHKWSACRACGRTAKQGERARAAHSAELAKLVKT